MWKHIGQYENKVDAGKQETENISDILLWRSNQNFQHQINDSLNYVVQTIYNSRLLGQGIN